MVLFSLSLPFSFFPSVSPLAHPLPLLLIPPSHTALSQGESPPVCRARCPPHPTLLLLYPPRPRLTSTRPPPPLPSLLLSQPVTNVMKIEVSKSLLAPPGTPCSSVHVNQNHQDFLFLLFLVSSLVVLLLLGLTSSFLSLSFFCITSLMFVDYF